jgi:hypothetical protein
MNHCLRLVLAVSFVALFGRVAQALISLASSTQWVPHSFAFFAKGGYHECLQVRSYATRSWNEILVQPSFRRTGPASSRR